MNYMVKNISLNYKIRTKKGRNFIFIYLYEKISLNKKWKTNQKSKKLMLQRTSKILEIAKVSYITTKQM